jgi:nitric oxide reductase activation protein
MVCGPRDGRWNYGDREDAEELQATTGWGKAHNKYHRTQSVIIDVFKDWNEKFNMCLDRFSKVTAVGGTPLSDGIQYAMQELSDRPERHRVIIVLTDGAANCPKVVNRQVRLAKEAGIHVIGVGIGSGCDCVKSQFPENYIQIPNVKDLPKRLLGILDDIMFPKTSKKASMDGRIGK